MSEVSKEFKLAVLRAMPAPPKWVTAQQVYKRMDYGAIGTIKQALLELSRSGEIMKFGPVMEPAFRINSTSTITTKKAIAAYREQLELWKSR
jgi:hypothetical protein